MSPAIPFLLLLAMGGAEPDIAAPPPIDAIVLVQFKLDEVARLGGCAGNSEEASSRLLAALKAPPLTVLKETVMTRVLREENNVVESGKSDVKPRTLDFSRWMLLVYKLPSPAKLDELESIVRQVRENPLILHAEPDYDMFESATSVEAKQEIETANQAADVPAPNDPLFHFQYYHGIIHTPETWQITTGSENVTVAVLDTGCKAELEDFGGRVLAGYDVVHDRPGATDEPGHGTSIASLIAATGNNGIGIAGMDWHCRVLPINAAAGGLAVWVDAIEYAVHAGARVINMSGRLKLPESSPLLERALEQAVAAGVVVVASAGNQNESRLSWPAASPHVISVGATDIDERLWQDPGERLGSNRGARLDIVAPGRDIVSLGVDGNKVKGQGTSCSAALVSGGCALMFAVNPALNPEQIRQILHRTADKIGPPGGYHDGHSEQYGYGCLNVFKAVQEAKRLASK